MFWDNFEYLCRKNNDTPNGVCKKLGFSNATATYWKQGRIPNTKTLEKIATFFGISVADLLSKETLPAADDPLPTADNIFPITRKAFPLLGDIACGEPLYADESHESCVMAGTEIDADFCLRAKGDSMTGARILDGDVVFIKKMPVVENGSIAAVIVGDEATLKRVYFYPQQQKLILNAENPKYEPLVYLGEELQTICILVKAVAFQSAVR